METYTFDYIIPSRGLVTSLYLEGTHVHILRHRGDKILLRKQYLGDIPGRVVTPHQRLEEIITCLLETHDPRTEAWREAWSNMLQSLCLRGYPDHIPLEKIQKLREAGNSWEDLEIRLSDHKTRYFAADLREYFSPLQNYTRVDD